jgi:hypothetical protein
MVSVETEGPRRNRRRDSRGNPIGTSLASPPSRSGPESTIAPRTLWRDESAKLSLSQVCERERRPVLQICSGDLHSDRQSVFTQPKFLSLLAVSVGVKQLQISTATARTGACSSRCGILVRAWTQKISSASLTRFTPPSQIVWVWAYRSAARSSRRTGENYGRLRACLRVPSSSSPYLRARTAHRNTGDIGAPTNPILPPTFPPPTIRARSRTRDRRTGGPSGLRNFRSFSLIGRSLMLATRTRISRSKAAQEEHEIWRNRWPRRLTCRGRRAPLPRAARACTACSASSRPGRGRRHARRRCGYSRW